MQNRLWRIFPSELISSKYCKISQLSQIGSEVVRLEEWLSQGNFLFGGIKLPNFAPLNQQKYDFNWNEIWLSISVNSFCGTWKFDSLLVSSKEFLPLNPVFLQILKIWQHKIKFWKYFEKVKIPTKLSTLSPPPPPSPQC